MLTFFVIMIVIIALCQYLRSMPAYRRYRGGRWYYYHLDVLGKSRKAWLREEERPSCYAGFNILLHEEYYA